MAKEMDKDLEYHWRLFNAWCEKEGVDLDPETGAEWELWWKCWVMAVRFEQDKLRVIRCLQQDEMAKRLGVLCDKLCRGELTPEAIIAGPDDIPF